MHLERNSELESEHTKIVLDRNALNEGNQILRREVTSATEKLIEINKDRNKLQAELKHYDQLVKDNEVLIDAKEHTILSMKSEIEKIESRIVFVTHEKEELSTKILAAERHFDQTQRQYQEKLENMEEIIAQNRKQKDKWANNYDKEQRSHIMTKEELVNTQAQVQDLEVNISNLKSSINILKKINKDNEHHTDDINGQVSFKLKMNLNF